MMKSKDCAVATALVINGYLRANEDTTVGKSDSDRHLADCLNAIRGEVDDWAENLAVPEGEDDCALEPEVLNVYAIPTGSGLLNRTPYNLVSVALAALREAVDLAGPESVMSDFQRRSTASPAPRSKPGRSGSLPTEVQLLVDAANELVAEIDAAVDRPVLKLAVFDNLCAQLRGQGVAVEDRITAPANW